MPPKTSQSTAPANGSVARSELLQIHIRQMPAYKYRILNVFTQKANPFSGNPLCVFEDGNSLDSTRMQALALQFNLSETTFILSSERASARVRIFTPRYELPFAGHPTLGTAHVCRALGLGSNKFTLEMTAGLIKRRRKREPLDLTGKCAYLS